MAYVNVSNFIVGHRIPSNNKAWLTIFPDYMYPPAASPFSRSLHMGSAYVQWKEHIWPVPVGMPFDQG